MKASPIPLVWGMHFKTIESWAKMKKMVSTVIKHKYTYIMLAPAFLVIFVFSYIPLFGWIIAFKDFSVVQGMWNSSWVGLDNFRWFFVTTSDYLYSVSNTLIMNFGTIIMNLSVAFIFSILLYEMRGKFFKKTLQVVSMFPFFISWTVAYSIIYAFLAPTSGVINIMLMKYGIISEPLNVLGDENYAWALIILSNLWKFLGYNAIMFIAAITGIEKEQFESAEIDGAGRFAKSRYILIPHMMATFVVLLILNSGYVFNSDLGQYMLFTNSTNWPKMEVLDMYIYKNGLEQGNFSYATAVGIIKTFISLLMVYGVNFASKKLTEKSIF